jgi:hypothetical protein
MKSGNLNILEPSGPLQACNGTTLPLPFEGTKFFNIGNVIKSRPTRCNKITVFIDLQDQLNMFWTKLCPSSGAKDCKLQLVVWCPAKTDIQGYS